MHAWPRRRPQCAAISRCPGPDRGRRADRACDGDVPRAARRPFARGRAAARSGSPLPRAGHFHLRTIELFRLGRDRGRGPPPVGEGFRPGGRHHRDGQPVGPQACRHHPGPQRRRRRHADAGPAHVHQSAGPRAHPAQARRRGRRHGARRLRADRLRAGRRRRHRDGARHRDRRGEHDPRALSDRRRRRAQQGARAARHPVRRPRHVLQQHDDLFPRRSLAAARRQAAQRHLHQQSGVRRLLPAREGLPVRLPGRQHGRRSEGRPGRGRQCRGRHQRAAADRDRARPALVCRTCR